MAMGAKAFKVYLAADFWDESAFRDSENFLGRDG